MPWGYKAWVQSLEAAPIYWQRSSHDSFKNFAALPVDAGESGVGKPLIAVEQVDGGWRVLARQYAETMCQVVVVPTEAEAREIAGCLNFTNILAANEALQRVFLGLFGDSVLRK